MNGAGSGLPPSGLPPSDPAPAPPAPGRPVAPRVVVAVAIAVVVVVAGLVVFALTRGDDGDDGGGKREPTSTRAPLDSDDPDDVARTLFRSRLTDTEYECVADELAADDELTRAIVDQEGDTESLTALIVTCLNNESIARELALAIQADGSDEAVAECVFEEVSALDTEEIEEAIAAYLDEEFTTFAQARFGECLEKTSKLPDEQE